MFKGSARISEPKAQQRWAKVRFAPIMLIRFSCCVRS